MTVTGLLVNRRQLKELDTDLEAICPDPPQNSLGEPYAVLICPGGTKMPRNGDLVALSQMAPKVTRIHYVLFSNRKKIVVVDGDEMSEEDLTETMRLLRSYMPTNTIVWGSMKRSGSPDKWIENGFGSPYMTRVTPLERDLGESRVALLTKNRVGETMYTPRTIKAKIQYAMKSGTTTCKITVRFTKEAVVYLRSLDGDTEVAGSLSVSNVDTDTHIFSLSPDTESASTGGDEQVDAVWGRYNFHTHPQKAYDNHEVTNGWPSSQDFWGFVSLQHHTIFHTVSTIEGLYTIAYSKKWLTSGKTVPMWWVMKNLDVPHQADIPYAEYATRASAMKYEEIPVFDVTFVPWSKAIGAKIHAYYAPTKGRCVTTTADLDMHKRL